MLVGTDGAGYFSDRDCFQCCTQTFNISHRFCKPKGKFKTERNRLCMDPMRSANHNSVLEFLCSPRKNFF